jgi:hypothetical protein
MCHCRMCQKWLGTAGAMTAWFDLATFRFTAGKPKIFKTSEILERSFCADCGTPLMHRYIVEPVGPDRAAIYIGTLDDPGVAGAPEYHAGIESRLTEWMILDPSVTTRRTEDNERIAAAWQNYRTQNDLEEPTSD